MHDELCERDGEVAELGAACDATTRGVGRLVIVEGPAGIGKSSLLLAARSAAAERGLPALAARGMELERNLPFGVARQLFVPSLQRASESERGRLLSGPAALAGPLLSGSRASLAAAGDGPAGALVEGLHWLAVNLTRAGGDESRTSGLVLVVDDAQWADRSSLRFLVHSIGQLEEIGFCVVMAMRTGEPDASADLLARLRAHPGTVRLRPPALSDGAVAGLVRGRGFPDAAEEFCLACAQATGGNPFLLGELLTVLHAEHLEPSSASARRVGELVPDAVLNAVAVNLGRLPESAARLAAAVAVLAQAPVELAAGLADLEVAEAEQAADALARAHLLVAAEPLSFVHPLIRAAVLTGLSPFARARAHRRAAGLLHRDGAAVSRVAVHLEGARPGGEPWASTALRAAAREALVHGEAHVAVRLLRRALAEPPPRDEQDAVLVELAYAESADDSPDAVARLSEALERVRDRRQRADAYNELARLLFFKGDIVESAAAAERGLAELDPDDELASQLVSAHLTAATLLPAALRAGYPDRLGAYLPDARAGRPPQDPLLCAHLCARMAVAGDPATLVRPVVERALGRHPLVDEAAHGVVLARPIIALLCIDELDRAVAALENAVRTERARMSLITQTVAHHWWAVVSYRRGDLVDAAAHDERALAAYRTDDWNLYGPWIAANLAQVHLEWGDIAAAREALDSSPHDAVDPISRALGLEARGRLALATGQPGAALDCFADAGRTLDGLGLVSPGFMAWRSSAALAAHRLGRREQADELVAAELAIAHSIGIPRWVGIALRAAGLVADGDRAIELLAESVRALERSAGRLERARSLTELGAALRRSGRRTAARPALREALDIAAAAGAGTLVQRAREELLATGGRPRRTRQSGVDALTPTERRIAELVSAGQTNTQIAHALYVTNKTVEWHLANVYRKLDIGGRGTLATALGERRPTARPGCGQG